MLGTFSNFAVKPVANTSGHFRLTSDYNLFHDLFWSSTNTKQESQIKAPIDIIANQGVLSWRASGDRQISLSASDERAFANFRVKNVVFTGTHFCAVLSMVGERAFVNFRKFVN